MPTNYPPSEGAAFKYQISNAEQPAGNTLTASLLAGAETPFATTATIPESACTIGAIAVIKAAGVFGSGVVALSQTINLKMQGQNVASFAFTPVASLVNAGWRLEVTLHIMPNGTIESQGFIEIGTLTGATVIPTRNTSTFTMSTVGGVPVVITNTFGGIALGGTITLRQLLVQVS